MCRFNESFSLPKKTKLIAVRLLKVKTTELAQLFE